MSICNLGVMGTEYVRLVAVPAETVAEQGDTITLSVENIYPLHAIGNVLDI